MSDTKRTETSERSRSASVLDEMFLTELQLSARHQRSVKTVRNDRLRGGYIPFVKVGRLVRYRLSDVLRWEESNLRTSTSDRGGENA
jgi:hypothetical protein